MVSRHLSLVEGISMPDRPAANVHTGRGTKYGANLRLRKEKRALLDSDSESDTFMCSILTVA
jgi:hypothetical protein